MSLSSALKFSLGLGLASLVALPLACGSNDDDDDGGVNCTQVCACVDEAAGAKTTCAKECAMVNTSEECVKALNNFGYPQCADGCGSSGGGGEGEAEAESEGEGCQPDSVGFCQCDETPETCEECSPDCTDDGECAAEESCDCLDCP